jgi:transcriptional regulator with XRE-family HTH domain
MKLDKTKLDSVKFGKAIREFRGRDTLLSIATKIGVEESTVQRVEKGQYPSANTLCKLLILTDLDYKQFLTEE